MEEQEIQNCPKDRTECKRKEGGDGKPSQQGGAERGMGELGDARLSDGLYGGGDASDEAGEEEERGDQSARGEVQHVGRETQQDAEQEHQLEAEAVGGRAGERGEEDVRKGEEGEHGGEEDGGR